MKKILVAAVVVAVMRAACGGGSASDSCEVGDAVYEDCGFEGAVKVIQEVNGFNTREQAVREAVRTANHICQPWHAFAGTRFCEEAKSLGYL